MHLQAIQHAVFLILPRVRSAGFNVTLIGREPNSSAVVVL